MKLYLFVMLLMLSCAIVHAQGDNKVIDSGKFTFLKSGKDSGSEIFTIKDDQNAEASSDLTLGGVENKFKTTTSYNGTSPKSFDLEKEPNIKLSFSFDGRVAKVTGVKEASAPVDPSAVILENVVWYQYYYLIRRYDQQKGGVQSFRAFVPSVLADIGATVELKDKSISLEGIPVKLNHYLAVFQVTLQVNIWTTTDGKLVYVTIPSQALEAVRQEYMANL